MLILSQAIKRKRLTNKNKTQKLKKNPHKKAICLKVLTIAPKKPNSANRRIVIASLTHYKSRLKAKVPGESHNLQQHSTVLVAGAKARDLIGINYRLIRGKYDLNGVTGRKNSRSRFGVKLIR